MMTGYRLSHDWNRLVTIDNAGKEGRFEARGCPADAWPCYRADRPDRRQIFWRSCEGKEARHADIG